MVVVQVKQTTSLFPSKLCTFLFPSWKDPLFLQTKGKWKIESLVIQSISVLDVVPPFFSLLSCMVQQASVQLMKNQISLYLYVTHGFIMSLKHYRSCSPERNLNITFETALVFSLSFPCIVSLTTIAWSFCCISVSSFLFCPHMLHLVRLPSPHFPIFWFLTLEQHKQSKTVTLSTMQPNLDFLSFPLLRYVYWSQRSFDSSPVLFACSLWTAFAFCGYKHLLVLHWLCDHPADVQQRPTMNWIESIAQWFVLPL